MTVKYKKISKFNRFEKEAIINHLLQNKGQRHKMCLQNPKRIQSGYIKNKRALDINQYGWHLKIDEPSLQAWVTREKMIIIKKPRETTVYGKVYRTTDKYYHCHRE